MVCHDRLLIGPPLFDDAGRRDRTRHHAPRARMDGWWTLAAGDIESRARRSHGEAKVTAIKVLPRRRSSILRQLCNWLSSISTLKRRSAAKQPVDSTTVLMDGSPRECPN